MNKLLEDNVWFEVNIKMLFDDKRGNKKRPKTPQIQSIFCLRPGNAEKSICDDENSIKLKAHFMTSNRIVM